MTVEEMLKQSDYFFKNAHDELTRKSRDYQSPDGKAFGDLRAVADEMNVARANIAFVHAAKHWTAIRRYVTGNALTSENIQMRLVDLANYCAIMTILINEDAKPELPRSRGRTDG